LLEASAWVGLRRNFPHCGKYAIPEQGWIFALRLVPALAGPTAWNPAMRRRSWQEPGGSSTWRVCNAWVRSGKPTRCLQKHPLFSDSYDIESRTSPKGRRLVGNAAAVRAARYVGYTRSAPESDAPSCT